MKRCSKLEWFVGPGFFLPHWLTTLQTFKSTNNHDLPTHATATVDLNLPELLTIDDLFPSMDFAYPMTQQPAIEASQDLDRDWTSTLNPQQSIQSRLTSGEPPLYNDDDLGLDLGDRDDDMNVNDTTVSINIGRSAPSPRPVGEDIFAEDRLLHDDEDLNLDLGEDVPMIDEPAAVPDVVDSAARADIFGAPDDGLALGDDETLQLQRAAEEQRRVRNTESPLSEAGSEVLRDLDRTFVHPDDEVEEEEVIAPQQRQRSRKQKPIKADVVTVLHNRQIKAQAEDRSKILKPASFLPRDPVLLTLMNMQKNGDFVTNAMNDGRSRNWAPELQGLLSFEVVHRSGQLKRKRDSGIGGLSEDEHSEKSPRLELSEAEDEAEVMLDEGVEVGEQRAQNQTLFDLQGADDGLALEDVAQREDDEGVFAGDDTFDDTTMPLVHPADNGPISLGTKHAVHLLRERLGGEQADGSPSSQTRKSVLLQELVPEGRTSREDATKMFFETLVLATKDAIKVEQGDQAIGMPLRIRAKRGLWGSWAETSPGDDPAGIGASQEVTASA